MTEKYVRKSVAGCNMEPFLGKSEGVIYDTWFSFYSY